MIGAGGGYRIKETGGNKLVDSRASKNASESVCNITVSITFNAWIVGWVGEKKIESVESRTYRVERAEHTALV